MEKATLSTAEKEAVLKMAGVLIRTSKSWVGNDVFDAVGGGCALTITRGNRETAIYDAYKRLIKGELSWLN